MVDLWLGMANTLIKDHLGWHGCEHIHLISI